MKTIFYIMGVSGSGKSTVGESLATQLSIPFVDGDDFHPQANVDKMSQGKPLNDEDRKPWLQSINAYAKKCDTDLVVACSALKEIYRTWLSENQKSKFILLDGTFELISERMKKREGHFMPPALLQSQFDTLEITTECIPISIDQDVTQITETIVKEISKKDIGIIGMGVMGKNLARNMARKDFSVSLFNRRVPGKEENVAADIAAKYPEFSKATAFEELAPFVANLAAPRKILLMVPAGAAVDQVIDQLKPLCSAGDVIIDGGNSFFKDTETRYADLKKMGIGFLGMGVSGGETGALEGPAIMPACSEEAYAAVKDILESIAAKNKLGQSCCQRIGTGGAGHFVKMVHNGIEYAEMQLIAEVYDLFKTAGYNNEAIAKVFSAWQNEEGYGSYLLEISIRILKTKDEQGYILDRILDKASNKGTGAWTSVEGIQLGIPFNIISSALYARFISSFKSDREAVASQFEETHVALEFDLPQLKSAYHCARILNHIQGLKYISTAAEKYEWNLDLSTIAQIWTGGCIIKSDLMFQLVDILKSTDDLIASPAMLDQIKANKEALQYFCTLAIEVEVPIPSFAACINYLHGIKQARSSANMIQAQRDFFGAHTYKLVQDPNGPSVHTNWELI